MYSSAFMERGASLSFHCGLLSSRSKNSTLDFRRILQQVMPEAYFDECPREIRPSVVRSSPSMRLQVAPVTKVRQHQQQSRLVDDSQASSGFSSSALKPSRTEGMRTKAQCGAPHLSSLRITSRASWVSEAVTILFLGPLLRPSGILTAGRDGDLC